MNVYLQSHFSSSPIKNVKGLQTPEVCDKQQQREFFSSPELSPIVKGRICECSLIILPVLFPEMYMYLKFLWV